MQTGGSNKKTVGMKNKKKGDVESTSSTKPRNCAQLRKTGGYLCFQPRPDGKINVSRISDAEFSRGVKDGTIELLASQQKK